MSPPKSSTPVRRRVARPPRVPWLPTRSAVSHPDVDTETVRLTIPLNTKAGRLAAWFYLGALSREENYDDNLIEALRRALEPGSDGS